jgi:hypothetical protein
LIQLIFEPRLVNNQDDDRQRTQSHQPARDQDMQRLSGFGIIVIIVNDFMCLCAHLSGAVLRFWHVIFLS